MRRFSYLAFLFALVCRSSGFTSPFPKSRNTFVTTTNPINFKRVPSRDSSARRLSAVPPEILTSFLPVTLGFYKSEFGVSYAYGLATALSSLTILKRFPTGANPILPLHAMALIFYGSRLNIFLALRTMTSARMRGFVEKIEERAKARGNRLSRAPFLFSCGLLYYGLVAPLLLTEKLTADLMSPSWVIPLMKTLVGVEWFGFLLAALGDFTKTYVKQTEGEDKLVTSGVFSILRHPNYTGEMIAWTANNLVGVVAFTLLVKSNSIGLLRLLGTFAAMTVGWTGIIFVLMQATRGLETRQKEQHGDDSDYASWMSSTWPGWMLPPKDTTDAISEPKIELDANQIEDFGSGI